MPVTLASALHTLPELLPPSLLLPLSKLLPDEVPLLEPEPELLPLPELEPLLDEPDTPPELLPLELALPPELLLLSALEPGPASVLSTVRRPVQAATSASVAVSVMQCLMAG